MFKFTQKHLQIIKLALDKNTRGIVCEGTSRSSKTFILTVAYYLRVMDSDYHLHCISTKNSGVMNDSILNSDYGLMKVYNNTRLVRPLVGSNYLEIDSNDKGVKRNILAAYGDTTKWQSILGKGIETFLITECNIADKDFIDETFSRQEACEYPLTLMDLNGDNPDHNIYKERINACTIVGDCPDSIREDMDKVEKKDGWYYFHFTRKDNPRFTPEMIERALSDYVAGSFRYFSKGLGLRVAPEGSIFADVLTPLKKQLVELNDRVRIRRMFMGIDYDKDIKVFTITAELMNGMIVIVDFMPVDGNVGIDELDAKFKEFVSPYVKKYQGRFKHIYTDHNEFTTTKSLKQRNPRFSFYPAEKQGLFGIEERIDNLLPAFRNGVIKFTEKSVPLISHYNRLIYDKSGRKWDKDNKSSKEATHWMDSMFYSLCKVWLRLRFDKRKIDNTKHQDSVRYL